MQSEPSAIFENDITEPTSYETRTSTHHGLQNIDETESLSPAGSAGSGTTTSVSADRVAADAALAASLQGGWEVLAQSGRRLSPQSTPSPPVGRNRVTEYEQASTTPPTKKKSELGFEVIKKYRSPGDKRSPIQELPNGLRKEWNLSNHFEA